ncbi:MAG: glycosyltransferase family 2 protein [Bacteroidales bacterium]|nr:glycosyltransferase [Bacteroidales bacterium]MDD4293736.1 glycosyltransferase family 2 protein [Bacteroidales bacterium]MDD4491091.1 glycosyltransferase family 2 protein [Bacteroidales bacterium]
MKWYDKYLTVFEKPFIDASEETICSIKSNLSALQSENPVASVIIIAHNEEKRLLSCLWSLSDSICKYPIEIIGVNNSSTDRTADVYQSVGLRYFDEERKSSGYARNRGLYEAKGKYCICIDSDTMYPEKYVEIMIDKLEKPGVVAVCSLWSYVPSKEFPRFWMSIYEFIRDIHLLMLSFKNPEYCVRGMVFAHVTDLAKQYGFRVDLKRGEDGSMTLCLKKHGKVYFVRSRKARAVTSTSTLSSDGSLANAFWQRVKGALKGAKKYFVKKKGVIKDDPSNLIN